MCSWSSWMSNAERDTHLLHERGTLCVCIECVHPNSRGNHFIAGLVSARIGLFSLYLGWFLALSRTLLFFFLGLIGFGKKNGLLSLQIQSEGDDLLSNTCLPINLSHSHSLARQTFLLLVRATVWKKPIVEWPLMAKDCVCFAKIVLNFQVRDFSGLMKIYKSKSVNMFHYIQRPLFSKPWWNIHG
jgi:hypothetical protein